MASDILGGVNVELLQPVPMGDIDPSALSFSNLTGTWSRLNSHLPFQVFTGTFDIPVEITQAKFLGVDDFRIDLSPVSVNSYFINEVVDGQLVQVPATPVNLRYSSVPEPGQYLMFGLVAVGCVTWRYIRRKK